MALARDGRTPAVVLLTGSGPQDRDEALMGHRPFLVIADALARAGVAVLRCDDRGVARSTGDFNAATSTDFASDAEAAVDWLKTQPSIDPSRIGLVGHSEGGLIAPIVAWWENEGDAPTNPLAFMVLLAGTAEQGGKLLTRQSKALYDAAGVPAEKSGPALAAHAAAMAAVMEGKPADEVRPLIEEMVRRQVAIGSLVIPDDATLKPTFDAAMTQISSPWMMEFIRFDPRGVLATIEIPTLAMFGSKDTQVDMETNLGIMEDIARSSGAPITTRRLEGLNHLFQPATTGVIEEYGQIDTTFEPKALAEMVAWVVETAKAAPFAQVPDAKRPAGWSRPAADMLPKRPEVKPATSADPKSAPEMPTRRGIGGAAPAAPASSSAPMPPSGTKGAQP
jgi:pimeloyl-ACP methyl ester carboxylesterase